MKRVRALTEQERALWAQVAATVTPRKRQRRPVQTEAADVKAAQARGAADSPPDALRSEAPALMPRPAPAEKARMGRPPPPPLAPIERRLKQRLSRGQREVDAKIDLHGLRQEEAHAALSRFIHGAHMRNAGLILVVTGKGGRKPADDAGFYGLSGGERGVLHRLVPLWLSDPDLRRFVIGFEQAAASHGGSGALYVRIRRARGA